MQSEKGGEHTDIRLMLSSSGSFSSHLPLVPVRYDLRVGVVPCNEPPKQVVQRFSRPTGDQLEPCVKELERVKLDDYTDTTGDDHSKSKEESAPSLDRETTVVHESKDAD